MRKEFCRARRPCFWGVVSGIVLTGFCICYGAALQRFGNAPLHEANYSNWPGLMPAVNDSCRVYQKWINGEEGLFYRGNTAALNAHLQKYGAANIRRHTLVLREGKGQTLSLEGKAVSFDWELHLCAGTCRLILQADADSYKWDPFVVVYADGISIDSHRIVIPANLEVIK